MSKHFFAITLQDTERCYFLIAAIFQIAGTSNLKNRGNPSANSLTKQLQGKNHAGTFW